MSDIFPSLTIPNSAGIGLRSRHIAEVVRRRPSIGWLEVHAENYMGHSAAASALEALRERYALSVHGVGLSLGSAGGLDKDHLDRLYKVCLRFQPDLVSEHLAWSVADGAFLNDLLPLRYDEEALAIVARNVDQLQSKLKRRVLIENLSAYIAFEGSVMSEAQFLAELVTRTGCGLLLDVNNVHVSAHNLEFDARAFIDSLPAEAIDEIHLAGHAVNQVGDDTVLIDDHGSRVPPVVWSLYAYALGRIGARPTLIEWDTEVPELSVLLGEMMWADLLSGSITAGRREKAVSPQVPNASFATTIVPFAGKRPNVRMPALAAFEALRATSSTNLFNQRSTRHVVAR